MISSKTIATALARFFPGDPEGRSYAKIIASKAGDLAATDHGYQGSHRSNMGGRKQTVDANVTSEVN